MKKLLPILSLAAIMTACKNEATTSVAKPAADTSGLAQFQAWKTAQSLPVQEEATIQYEEAVAVAAPQRVVRKARPAASAPRTTTREVVRETAPAEAPVVLSNETSQPAKKKEGWSKAAKGAVIGGVAGAAGGAAINKKNRVVGAVIGAVAGAGGGYAIGRGMDKKDGRYFVPE